MRCSVWPGWVLIKPDKDLSPVHGSLCCHSVRQRWWRGCAGGRAWLWHSEVIFTSYQRVCKSIAVARRNGAVRLADEVNMCRSRPSFSFTNAVFHPHILQKPPLSEPFSFHPYYHSSSRAAFRGRGLIKFNKNNK